MSTISIHSVVLKLTMTVGVVLSLLSVSAIFSSYHLFFDLLSNFRVQYVVLIPIVLCIALARRAFLIGLLVAACLLVHVVELVQSQAGQKLGSVGEGTTVRVMSSNLLVTNSEHRAHIEYIQSINPDVIVFQEYSAVWHKILSNALTEFTHKSLLPLDHAFGIALYSKFPFATDNIRYLTHSDIPSVEAVLNIGTETLKVLGTHPPPPTSQDFYRHRNLHLLKLAELSYEYSEPLIVVGDLNITPWSSHFKKFIEKSGLSDARRGFGILPTWPTSFFPLQIPIDHIVVNEGARVLSMSTSQGLESDHKSIWADILVH